MLAVHPTQMRIKLTAIIFLFERYQIWHLFVQKILSILHLDKNHFPNFVLFGRILTRICYTPLCSPLPSWFYLQSCKRSLIFLYWYGCQLYHGTLFDVFVIYKYPIRFCTQCL